MAHSTLNKRIERVPMMVWNCQQALNCTLKKKTISAEIKKAHGGFLTN